MNIQQVSFWLTLWVNASQIWWIFYPCRIWLLHFQFWILNLGLHLFFNSGWNNESIYTKNEFIPQFMLPRKFPSRTPSQKNFGESKFLAKNFVDQDDFIFSGFRRKISVAFIPLKWRDLLIEHFYSNLSLSTVNTVVVNRS